MTLSVTNLVYGALLSVLPLISLIAGRAAMFRTGIAILGSWLACVGIVYWLRDPAPWLWFTLIDSIACVIVTVRPAGKMQSIIGGVFAAEIFCHFIFGTTANVSTDKYLDSLTVLSDVQLVLYMLWLGGGACVRIAHSASDHWLRRHSRHPDAPSAPRLG